MDRYPYCPALDIEAGLELLARRDADLTPAQLVDLCAFLRDNGVQAREIGRILGCGNYQVSHWVRISRQLHPEVKDLLHRGRLSIGHCRAVAGLPLDEQVAIARTAIVRRESVRDLEKARGNNDRRLSADDLQYYERLGERISEAIGHPVSIRPNPADRQAGTLTIQYADADMFDAICHRLRIDLQELI
jgi:ParB family chromosome partitioning protein